MSRIRAVTVYCSSSRHVAAGYFDAARELGRAIAREDWSLVYGGNNIGLMDAVACAAREAGGRVVGITPRLMVDAGIVDRLCTELIVTDDMRQRKGLLESRGDAFVALPGGLGTFEEFFEILVARMLGYHQKPIVVLNVDDYYAPLLAMIEHGIEQRFIKPQIRQSYFVAASVTQAMEHLRQSAAAVPAPAPSQAAAVQEEPSATE